MQYGIGGENMDGGGTNLLIKFKDGKATIQSEIETNVPAWTEATSDYDVNMETGPVLTFDTYNPVLHYFTEPHSSQLQGQKADFEFIIMAASDSTIVLQGKKYHARLIMKRLPDNFDPNNFKTGIEHIKNSIYYTNYTISSENKPVGELDISENGNTLTGTVNGKPVSLPFVYSTSGIELLDTLRIGDKHVTSLKYDEANKNFENKNEKIELFGKTDKQYEDFIGQYTFYADGKSSIKVNLTPLKYAQSFKMIGYTLRGINGTFIVKYKDGHLSFAAQTLAGSEPLLRAFLVGDYLQSDPNEELVSQLSENTTNQYYFVTNGVGYSDGLLVGYDDDTGNMTGINWSKPFEYLYNIYMVKAQ